MSPFMNIPISPTNSHLEIKRKFTLKPHSPLLSRMDKVLFLTS